MSRSRSSVVDRDRGYAKLVREAEKLAAPTALTIGLHDDAGGHSSGRTVAEIGSINEFGEGPPARPFVGGWYDENRAQVDADLERVAARLTKGEDVEMSLERLGLQYVGDIQARISAGIDPPNAESTIRRKGSSKPLINTGQMRSSVRHKVER